MPQRIQSVFGDDQRAVSTGDRLRFSGRASRRVMTGKSASHMPGTGGDLGETWNAPGWVEFYSNRRATTGEIYPSEWHFLHELLAEGMSVLVIGCALGGLASVLGEHLSGFSYTGVDISSVMIDGARQRHPKQAFHVIGEADLSPVEGRRFDLVVCLGVLHLSRKWRQMIAAAWACTGRHYLMDL